MFISIKSFYFLIFINNLKLSLIVDNVFRDKRFFLFSKTGLSYIKNKIFISSFNKLIILVFFNNTFRIKPKFFRFFFRTFFRNS